MPRYPFVAIVPAVLAFCLSFASRAELNNLVSLNANAHVCNTEAEVARLAENQQLQEMARALVEFKPTKYCFIMPDAADVVLLQQHPGYIKFDYKSQVLYTFNHYIVATTLTANSH